MRKRSKNLKMKKAVFVSNTNDVHYRDKDNTIGYAVSGMFIIGIGAYQYFNENNAAGILLGVIGLAFIGMSIYENFRAKKLGLKK